MNGRGTMAVVGMVFGLLALTFGLFANGNNGFQYENVDAGTVRMGLWKLCSDSLETCDSIGAKCEGAKCLDTVTDQGRHGGDNGFQYEKEDAGTVRMWWWKLCSDSLETCDSIMFTSNDSGFETQLKAARAMFIMFYLVSAVGIFLFGFSLFSSSRCVVPICLVVANFLNCMLIAVACVTLFAAFSHFNSSDGSLIWGSIVTSVAVPLSFFALIQAAGLLWHDIFIATPETQEPGLSLGSR